MKVGYVVTDKDIDIQRYELTQAGCERLIEVPAIELNQLSSENDIYIWRVDKMASDIRELEIALSYIEESKVNVTFVVESLSSHHHSFALLPQLAARLSSHR